METQTVSPGDKRRRGLSLGFLIGGAALLGIAALVGISDNPPGIVAMLLGICSLIVGGFMLMGRQRNRTVGQELLFWAPRATCITCAIFISMFAMDVFGEGRDLWGTVMALLMHLLPTFIIVLVLVVSWRREWIGGIIFIAAAFAYLWSIWHTRFFWSAGPLISGPLLITGILFLLNWSHRAELRGTSA